MVGALVRSASLALTGRPADALAVLWAWGWNVKELPVTLVHRRRLQKQRKVDDSALAPLRAPGGQRLRALLRGTLELVYGAEVGAHVAQRADDSGEEQDMPSGGVSVLRVIAGHPVAFMVATFALVTVAYGSCSTPSRVHSPAPASHPSGAASWCSRRRRAATPPPSCPPARRSAARPRSSPASAPAPAARRTASTPHSGSRRHSGKRTGSELPSTPQPEPVLARRVGADQQQPAVGVGEQQPVVAALRDLQQRGHLAAAPQIDRDRLGPRRPAPGPGPASAPPGPARRRRSTGPGTSGDLFRPERAARHQPDGGRRAPTARAYALVRPATGGSRAAVALRALDRAQRQFAGAGPVG